MAPTSSAAERSGQAIVVDEMLRSLFNTASTQGVAGYVFGGSRRLPPVEQHLGGYRFVSDGPGLVADLGVSSSIPLTLGAGNPVVSTSTRIHDGQLDLNPQLRLQTQLADLDGARGLSISPGTVQLSINSGTPIDVDLADAATVDDVVTRPSPTPSAPVRDRQLRDRLGSRHVNVSGEHMYIEAAAGSSVQFFDIGQEPPAPTLVW